MRTLLVILFCCILAGIFVPGCKRTRPPPLAEQPIDGLLIEYYDDEETIRKSQGIYRYGKLHGLYRIWWPNGQLMSQCDYENALKNGS